MSTLKFVRADKKIYLYAASGSKVASYHAENNVQRGAKIWPAGTYDFSYHTAHPGGDSDSAYGSNGNFVFVVSGRTGMGVHSGRSKTRDGHGNVGPAHVTNGCIRSTDECTAELKTRHRSDPLTSITVVG